jgi:hypothetical protein
LVPFLPKIFGLEKSIINWTDIVKFIRKIFWDVLRYVLRYDIRAYVLFSLQGPPGFLRPRFIA